MLPCVHRVTLTFDLFDLRIDMYRGPTTECTCTESGVNSSSRFSFRARTLTRADKVADATTPNFRRALRAPAGVTTLTARTQQLPRLLGSSGRNS